MGGNWTLEGIDLDSRAIKAATHTGLNVHLGSVETIDLPHGSYDLIFMIQTIEHVEKPATVLYAIYKLLRKGGRLVIVTDNTDSIDFKLSNKVTWVAIIFLTIGICLTAISLTKLVRFACSFKIP